MKRLRIVTYNVHKCRGLDGRVRPQRIAAVLREVGADIVALQEVLSIEGRRGEEDQAPFLAAELGMHHAVGENRRHQGGAYGNIVLSRFRLTPACNFDLSVKGREARGCLRADVNLKPGLVLHVFNVHLGTSYFERRRQWRKLVEEGITHGESLTGPRIVLGDFNEWAPGRASRLLAARLNSVDVRTHVRGARTYPSVFPLLHLDHIYFDDQLELEKLTLHRTRTALVASDHLPLAADFRLIDVPAVAAGQG